MSYKRHQRLQAPQLPQLPYEIWFRMINDLIQELFDGPRLGAGYHDEYGLKNRYTSDCLTVLFKESLSI